MENFKQVEYVRARCPQCQRMYSINPKEVRESKPRFECVNCHSQFWLAFPDCLKQSEVVGFPIEWLKSDLDFAESVETKECPKCHKVSPLNAKDCKSCGLVFDKYRAKKEDVLPSSPTIEAAWKKVLDRYESEERHFSFLRVCQSEDNLSNALHRYSALIEAQPMDRLAKKMRDSAKALLENKASNFHMKSKPKRPFLRPLGGVMVLLSVSLLIWGCVSPEFRNMIGVGSAFLFMSIALQFYRA